MWFLSMNYLGPSPSRRLRRQTRQLANTRPLLEVLEDRWLPSFTLGPCRPPRVSRQFGWHRPSSLMLSVMTHFVTIAAWLNKQVAAFEIS